MSNLDIRAIAPAGYVRACFSERARGFCLPAELVRRHLGAVNTAGVRRRLSREFAGYLVTDPPVAVTYGVWRDAGGVVVLGARVTGRNCVDGLQEGFEDFERGACLDACEWLPIGRCGQYEVGFGDLFCSRVGYLQRCFL